MEVWRLKKLPFEVNCAHFILSAVIHRHLEGIEGQQYASVVELMKKSFFVDDLISSLPDQDQALQFQTDSTEIMQRAGMELRKWRGNAATSDEVVGAKVLGIGWNTSSDRINLCAFSHKADASDQGNGLAQSTAPRTRRQLLHTGAGLFDPVGLVCPVVITGNIILQVAWKEEGDWDDEMSEPLIK